MEKGNPGSRGGRGSTNSCFQSSSALILNSLTVYIVVCRCRPFLLTGCKEIVFILIRAWVRARNPVDQMRFDLSKKRNLLNFVCLMR